MINKRGFTLIEIVISVGLLFLICTSAFITVFLVNKKTNIKELNQMKDKIYLAVSVYLENNKEAKEQIYQKENGAVIPLNILQKEGLIDFKNINIKRKYVVAALGNSVNSTECVDVSIVNSWDKGDKVIYLCGNNNQELKDRIKKLEDEIEILKSNLKTEEKIFKGYIVNNYLKYNNHLYRIIEITSDKSIILTTSEIYEEDFSIDNIYKYNTFDWGSDNCDKLRNQQVPSTCETNSKWIVDSSDVINYCRKYNEVKDKGYSLLEKGDLIKIDDCENAQQGSITNNNTLPKTLEYLRSNWINFDVSRNVNNTFTYPITYKVHLKNCFIISEGDGSNSNPYNLINKC